MAARIVETRDGIRFRRPALVAAVAVFFAAGCAPAHAPRAEAPRRSDRGARAGSDLTPVPIPAPIRASGYEAGLQPTIDAQGVEALAVACDVRKARRFVDAAGRSFGSKSFYAARGEAYSAMATVGRCRAHDRAARVNGDAALLFARSELHLGMPGAGKDDAEFAAAMYLDCDARHGYAKADAGHCRSQLDVARRMTR